MRASVVPSINGAQPLWASLPVSGLLIAGWLRSTLSAVESRCPREAVASRPQGR